MRQALAVELSKPSKSDPNERVFESMIHGLVELAKDGERWAIEMVLDRICGKPAQAVALTGEGGALLTSECSLSTWVVMTPPTQRATVSSLT